MAGHLKKEIIYVLILWVLKKKKQLLYPNTEVIS